MIHTTAKSWMKVQNLSGMRWLRWKTRRLIADVSTNAKAAVCSPCQRRSLPEITTASRASATATPPVARVMMFTPGSANTRSHGNVNTNIQSAL